jgi:hypothetical protein
LIITIKRFKGICSYIIRMNLSRYELSSLLKDFPNIELSYEKNIHKTVPSSNIYLTIPKGKKYFAWFRNWKKYNICFFMELDNRRKNIQTIFIKNACFDPLLCSGVGTILYGTLFHINTSAFLNVENIYYFKGRNISAKSQFEKINILQTLFANYLKPLMLSKADVAFGLPLMSTNRDNLIKKCQNIPYALYCIQHRLLHKHRTFLNERIDIIKNYEFNFTIKATIHPDIYNLYYDCDGVLTYYKCACIPNYKTSVFMNSLFRDIKENANLDRLEESDDEEEFENISDDKFVDLEKALTFKCVYLKYYDSWKPLTQTSEALCNEKDIQKIEKYNAK